MLPIDQEPNFSSNKYEQPQKGFHAICVRCKRNDLYWHHNSRISYVDFLRIQIIRCAVCGMQMYQHPRPVRQSDMERRRWVLKEVYNKLSN